MSERVKKERETEPYNADCDDFVAYEMTFWHGNNKSMRKKTRRRDWVQEVMVCTGICS